MVGESSLNKPGEQRGRQHYSGVLLQVPALSSLNDRCHLKGEISPFLPKLALVSVYYSQRKQTKIMKTKGTTIRSGHRQ